MHNKNKSTLGNWSRWPFSAPGFCIQLDMHNCMLVWYVTLGFFLPAIANRYQDIYTCILQWQIWLKMCRVIFRWCFCGSEFMLWIGLYPFMPLKFLSPRDMKAKLGFFNESRVWILCETTIPLLDTSVKLGFLGKTMIHHDITVKFRFFLGIDLWHIKLSFVR